jgi:hypothetical protein
LGKNPLLFRLRAAISACNDCLNPRSRVVVSQRGALRAARTFLSEKQASIMHTRFPRASKYDTQWMIDNAMGPNVLWLTEWLCEAVELKPGMRVLDLGCGKAASSIFLAREFGLLRDGRSLRRLRDEVSQARRRSRDRRPRRDERIDQGP